AAPASDSAGAADADTGPWWSSSRMSGPQGPTRSESEARGSASSDAVSAAVIPMGTGVALGGSAAANGGVAEAAALSAEELRRKRLERFGGTT
ncbi:unnamed protein product, partial [Polarella glacialis]